MQVGKLNPNTVALALLAVVIFVRINCRYDNGMYTDATLQILLSTMNATMMALKLGVG